MTDIDKILEEVERLDATATPGPWKGDEGAYHVYGSHGAIDSMRLPDGSTGVRIIDIRGWGSLSKLGDKEAERIQRANGALVTTFRTAAPALAKEVRRLRAKLVEAACELAMGRYETPFKTSETVIREVAEDYGIRLKFEDGRFVESK